MELHRVMESKGITPVTFMLSGGIRAGIAVGLLVAFALLGVARWTAASPVYFIAITVLVAWALFNSASGLYSIFTAWRDLRAPLQSTTSVVSHIKPVTWPLPNYRVWLGNGQVVTVSAEIGKALRRECWVQVLFYPRLRLAKRVTLFTQPP